MIYERWALSGFHYSPQSTPHRPHPSPRQDRASTPITYSQFGFVLLVEYAIWGVLRNTMCFGFLPRHWLIEAFGLAALDASVTLPTRTRGHTTRPPMGGSVRKMAKEIRNSQGQTPLPRLSMLRCKDQVRTYDCCMPPPVLLISPSQGME